MPEAVIVETPSAPPSAEPSRAPSRSFAPTRWAPSWSTPLLERNPGVDPELIEDVDLWRGPAPGVAGLQPRPHRRPALRAAAAPNQRRHGVALLRVVAWNRFARHPMPCSRARATPTSPRAWNGCRATTRRIEAARPQDQNERLQGKNGDPDVYIPMGLTAENVRARQWGHQPGAPGTSSPGVVAEPGRRRARPTGSSTGRSTPSPAGRGRGVRPRRVPPPRHHGGNWPSSSPRSSTTARSRPATRAPSTTAPPPCRAGRAAGPGPWGSRPLARILHVGHGRGSPPRSMGVGSHRRLRKLFEPRGHVHPRRLVVELNEAFAARSSRWCDEVGIESTASSTRTAGDRPRPPVRHDRARGS